MNPDLAFLLDSIADHIGALRALRANPGIDPEFAERLRQHVLLEERQNSEALAKVRVGEDEAGVLQVAKDHSFFIQKLLTSDTIPQAMYDDLLHHFAEEHERFEAGMHEEASQPRASPEAQPTAWTVGPLRRR